MWLSHDRPDNIVGPICSQYQSCLIVLAISYIMILISLVHGSDKQTFTLTLAPITEACIRLSVTVDKQPMAGMVL